jgi:hypothetical protein
MVIRPAIGPAGKVREFYGSHKSNHALQTFVQTQFLAGAYRGNFS